MIARAGLPDLTVSHTVPINTVSTKTVSPEVHRLDDVAPQIARLLAGGDTSLPFAATEIRRETVFVTMRDGVRLATELYLPPVLPAPVIAMRTPYGRASQKNVAVCLAFARGGYVVVAQDCRGTGDSEPESWDYYVYETEDGLDVVEWVSQQEWFGGFLGAFGGSYTGQTQWCMAMHPRMSTLVPEVSSLGVAINTAHLYLFIHSYARSVGKGEGKVAIHYTEMERLMKEETLAGGYFNEPLHQPFSAALLSRYPSLRTMRPAQAKRWLWEQYCALPCAQRAALIEQALGVNSVSMREVESLSAIFGHRVAHDAHTLPHAKPTELCRSLHAPPLMVTGWYDWALNDELATFELLRREALEPVRSRSRLLITPSAHNVPGYHEGMEDSKELQRTYRTESLVGLLLHWYGAVREGTTDEWPTVIYYLMGANEWRVAADWPPPEARQVALHLGPGGTLAPRAPQQPSTPDRYTYNPEDPTPTVGGSILSNVYPPGSVDVSEVQKRPDVLTYTTAPLERDLDVVGPLRLILYASSSALDTDFNARLSDVFPDGRAIQLQSGILRARFRNLHGEPELLEPGRIYSFEIDMWATANRFKRGHRLRLDIASADFPRFDRSANRGGEPGAPVPAMQTIYHDPQHPSHLLISVLKETASALPEKDR